MEHCDKCIWFDYVLGCFPSCDRNILNERFLQACSQFMKKTIFDEKAEVKDWLRYAYNAYRRIVGTVPDRNDVVQMLTDIRNQVRNGFTYKEFVDMEDAAIYYNRDV